MKNNGNSRVTLEMPKDAAERLIKKFEENPEELKKEFEKYGFEVIDIKENVIKN